LLRLLLLELLLLKHRIRRPGHRTDTTRRRLSICLPGGLAWHGEESSHVGWQGRLPHRRHERGRVHRRLLRTGDARSDQIRRGDFFSH
jgi:hypothetical protein